MSVGKIMVVEDDLTLSAGLCFELDMSDYLTVAAYSAKKARQLVAEESFDLAVLDVNLPDGSGFELCREFKESHPDMPVVFLTANDLEENVVEGFDLGADDYITKPFSMKIFLKRIEVAMRRGKPREDEKTQESKQVWKDGFLCLDFGRLTAMRGQERIAITPNEYKLLRVLTENSGSDIIGIVRSYSRSVFLSYMDPLRICPLSGSAPWDPGSLRRDVCADHTLEMLCKKAGDRFRR